MIDLDEFHIIKLPDRLIIVNEKIKRCETFKSDKISTKPLKKEDYLKHLYNFNPTYWGRLSSLFPTNKWNELIQYFNI